MSVGSAPPWSESCARTRNTGNGFRRRGVIVDDSIGPCPGDGVGADIRSGWNVTGNGEGWVAMGRGVGRSGIYGQNRPRGVGKRGKRGRIGHVVELLEMMILRAEFVKEVFSGVFLKSLRKESCSERVRRDEKGTDLHVVEDGGAERQEIGVDWVQDVHGPPSVASGELTTDGLGGRGGVGGRSVLLDELVAREGDARDAVAVGVHVWGREGVGQAHVGGGDWGGRGRGGGGAVGITVGGIAVEGLWRVVVVVIVLWVVGVHIEDAEADAGLCEVSADGDFDGSQAVIGEGVCAGDDGEDVDAGGETTDGGDLVGGEGGSAQIGMGCDGGFEDHGIGIRGRETVGACTRNERGHWGTGNRRGHDVVRIEKVNAAVRGSGQTEWRDEGGVTHAQMDVMVSVLGFPVLGERETRGSARARGEGKGGAHVLDALGIAGVNVAQDVGNETVGGGLVGKVEGGGVDEGEGETTAREGVVVGDVDVERGSADVGGVGRRCLYEFCEGEELVCGCGVGDVGCVDEETEEGSLSGALSCYHEGVSGRATVVEIHGGGRNESGL